jgi:hypothetical protein
LCRWAGSPRPDGSIRLDVPLTIQDLAVLSRFGRDQVSRALIALAAENVIGRTSNGWFTIPPGSNLVRPRATRTVPDLLGGD